jgi:hypothetical protein
VVQTYVLESYLQCTEFGNAVMEVMCRSVRREDFLWHPGPTPIRNAFKSTVEGWALRRLSAALQVWKFQPAWWKDKNEWRDYLEFVPRAYTHDLVMSLHKRSHHLERDSFVKQKTSQLFLDMDTGCRLANAGRKTQD